MRVAGWKLDPDEREALLHRFPPAYGRVVADHVTLKPRASEDAAPPAPVRARVVGLADDGKGVQALVVEIDGSTDRPDGSTWHVTWSLGPGRRAVESNDVIRERGWAPVEPEPLALTPAVWP